MLLGVGKRPIRPSALLNGPFSIDEARRHGLDRWHMEGASRVRIGPKTYLWSGLRHNPVHMLEAARNRLPPGGAFSGLTAAWLHGIDVGPCDPIEGTVPKAAGVSARAGMTLRRSGLVNGGVVFVDGMPVTSIVRTIGEVC